MATNRRQILPLCEEALEIRLARIWMIFSLEGLRRLWISPAAKAPPPYRLIPVIPADPACRKRLDSWITQTTQALQDYFAGKPPDFSALKLDLTGTAFQCRVWEEVRRIPLGATASYSDLARALGLSKGARAVGGALKANPVPIIIPCHRIVKADGSLGGFSAGLSYKRWLLTHEQAMLASSRATNRGIITPGTK